MKKLIYKIILYTGIILIACYFAIFMFALPYLATTFLPNKLKAEKNIDLQIENFFANPFNITFTIQNLKLQENNSTLLSADKLYINPSVIKTIIFGTSINEIKIDNPIINIFVDKNKTINFVRLAEKFKNKEEQKKAVFNIESLDIVNGLINFKDQDFESNITKIDIKSKSISNSTNSKGSIEFFATLDSAKIDANTTTFLDKNNFLLDINIKDFEAKKYIKYFTDEFYFNSKININAKLAYTDKNLSVNIADANLTNLVFNDKKCEALADRLNFKTKYFDNTVQNTFSKIQNLVVNDGNNTLLKIQEITIDDVSYKKNLLKISKVEVEKPSLIIEIFKNFETNINNFISKYKTENKNENNNTAVMVDNFIINSGKISLKDTNLEKNNQFEISNFNTTIKKFNSIIPNLAYINTTFNTPISGSIELNGTKSKIDINAQNIDLPIFEPYLQKNANINIKSGNLFFNATLDTNTSTKLYANAALKNIYITDKSDQPITKLPLININKILFENNKTTISEILIKESETYVSIYKNQKSNISNLIIPTQQTEQKSSSSNFAVVTLKVQNATLNFSDSSLPIDFNTKIRNLNGSAYAIGSDITLPTTFNFRGEIPEYGYAKIKATANLAMIFKNSNFDIEFENIDIDTLSPYTMKFIGYKIDDGKLWLDLNYDITNYKLTSTNKIKIKDLKLGDVVDENATSLPLSLIISLLSDSDGYMKFEIPVSGSVDNPEFDLGSVVKDAIFTTLAHIAKSPFTFLASIFDSNEEELSHIYFDAGSSKLLPPQKESLTKLKQILQKRPTIDIKIDGTYNKEADTNSLRLKAFNKLITKKYGETSFGESKFEFIKKEYIAKFGNQKFLDESKKYNLADISNQEILTKEMVYQLIDSIVITETDLAKLAISRANAIFDFLTKDNTIDKARIKVNEHASESLVINDDGDIASKLEITN